MLPAQGLCGLGSAPLEKPCNSLLPDEKARLRERKLVVQSNSQWLSQEAGPLLLSLPRAQRQPQLEPQSLAEALCTGLPTEHSAQPALSAVTPPSMSPGSEGKPEAL